jgi:hypothetical protein
VPLVPVDDVQVPKAELHPVPQYAAELPQYPYWEQQLPCPDPVQVLPFEPHWPLVLMEAFLWSDDPPRC